jgi:hypothetical protein
MTRRPLGYATLLLTSVILLLLLVVALSSYRSVFQYFRMVEHRVMSMQQDWQVEGAMECVFAKSKLGALSTPDVAECKADVDQLSLEGHLEKRIQSSSGFSSLERYFTLPSANTRGAIKTSANLILPYAVRVMPDPGEPNEADEWQCVAIRYRHQLVASSLTTLHPYQFSILPYPGFPSSQTQQQRCAADHYSAGGFSSATQKDYYHDTDLQPFEDLFSVAQSQWFTVFSHPSVGRIPLSLDAHTALTTLSPELLPPVSFNFDCSGDILSRIEQGKDLIWVYGGCELNDNDITAMNVAIRRQFRDSGVILVIHNGLLAVTSQQAFQGLVMQFISPGSHLAMDWQLTSLAPEVEQFITQASMLNLQVTTNISYFQRGVFNPLAGLVLSAENTYAVINSALEFQFQRDLIIKPLSYIRPITWDAGRWGDEYAHQE